MTILFGFSTERFILLGADNRTTQEVSGRFVPHDDATQKIYRVPLGLVAGMGWRDLVYEVRDRFVRTPPTSNRDAAVMIREERDRTGLPHDHPMIRLTNWLVAYTTGDPPTVGLAQCHPQANYEPIVVAPPTAVMMPPAGMSDEVEERLRAVLNRHIVLPPTITAETDAAFLYASMIEQAVRLAAQATSTVSESFQLGFLSQTSVGISPIMTTVAAGVDWA
jgi:hypothetical protein